MTRTILITGATDGIGLALAQHYAAQGARLLLVGRRALAQLAGPLFTPATYCQADLAQPDCAAHVAAFVQQQGISRLDMLIHNAGLGAYGPVAAQPPEQLGTLLAVNLAAPLAVTHALLPPVLAARGRLVFISSVVAALPAPQYAAYAASKAALDGFARSLRVELGDCARVQVIHPGATRTGMHTKSGVPATMRWQRFPPAEQVAARIAAAIERGQPTATIGALNGLLFRGGRAAGGLLERLLRLRAAP